MKITYNADGILQRTALVYKRVRIHRMQYPTVMMIGCLCGHISWKI